MTDQPQPVSKSFEAGWYKDISNEDYHGCYGNSSSNSKVLLEKTAMHYHYEKTHHENKSTDTMDLGTAFHTLTLEPEEFDRDIIVRPESITRRAGGDWESFKIEAGKRTIITKAQYDKAQIMADNVRNHPMAGLLVESGIKESSVFWWYKNDDFDDDYRGQYKEMCKVRPDFVPKNYPLLIDLKSADNCGFTEFGKAMANYYYHLSGAMYLIGANQCQELLDYFNVFAFTNFVYIVVENKPPHEVTIYELSAEDRQAGAQLFKRSMRLLHEGRRDKWPGYTTDIRKTEMPPWSTRLPII